MDRRQFIVNAGSLAMTTHLLTKADRTLLADDVNQEKFPVAIFGKVFQKHSFTQLADVLEQTDADGVEATIRSGGHVDPEAKDFRPQLAKLVSTLADRGKRLLIAATDVNEVTPANRELLRILADNGVKHYRLGYWRYEPGTPMIEQTRVFAAKAKELAALNHELGLVGLYQNHAGKDYVGSLIWDLAIVFQDVPVRDLGVALDLRHLRAEIGGSYLTAVNAIRLYLRSVYLKDTKRVSEDGQELEEVPLGKGMVNRALFKDVWKSIAPAPISVHVEYLGQKPHEPGKDAVVIDAYKNDVATLRAWMS